MDASVFYSQIGVMIKEYRLKNNLTQLRLAELVDLSVATIASCERGKPLQLLTAFKLIRALEIPANNLFDVYLKNMHTKKDAPNDYGRLQK